MLFNSVHFLIFLPLVVMLYYSLRAKHRWVLLLIASYYFYAAWEPEYLVLILFSSVVDYWAAIKMSAFDSKKKRKPFLIISLISNLGLLGFFKYYVFANESLTSLFSAVELSYKYYHFEDLLLPVGISFYTFQTLSYSIEVYRGEQKAEKNFGIFALYVSFFPQLVAGPIERFGHLGKQFKKQISFDWENIRKGLQLMLFGFFVKLCVADNLASMVDPFFAEPLAYSSASAWMATIAYSFQIYCDFFGYSTIAIGSARMLGIDLMDNFKTPYLSLSITEFWKRWHISLSTWFRDYLYISLGGNRSNKGLWVRNILLVFLLSGLWHGANWTFVIWGAIHAVIYLLEKQFSFRNSSLAWKFFSWLRTFLLVLLAWVFFRARDFSNAKEVFKAMLGQGSELMLNPSLSIYVLFTVFVISDLVLYNSRFDHWLNTKNSIMRWLVYASMLFAILSLGGVENHPFIYFQF